MLPSSPDAMQDQIHTPPGAILPTHNCSGALKQTPEDFVVREILKGKAAPLTGICAPIAAPAVVGILVKKGLGTVEAIHLLSNHTNIPASCFGFCGKKDVHAHSSQWISIQNYSGQSLNVSADLFVHSLSESSSTLQLGDHEGNEFSIHIHDLSGDTTALADTIQNVRNHGFTNYFDTQRFGSRACNHLIGEHLLAGRYTVAAETLLTFTDNRESAEVTGLRAALAEADARTRKILIELFLPMLRTENEYIAAQVRGEDALSFWKMRVKQSRFFVNSYTSYLWNTIASQSKDSEIPLFCLETQPLYEKALNQPIAIDTVAFRSLSPRPHIRKRLIIPGNFTYTHYEKTLTLSFTLEKGAYATMLCKHLVTLKP